MYFPKEDKLFLISQRSCAVFRGNSS